MEWDVNKITLNILSTSTDEVGKKRKIVIIKFAKKNLFFLSYREDTITIHKSLIKHTEFYYNQETQKCFIQ